MLVMRTRWSEYPNVKLNDIRHVSVETVGRILLGSTILNLMPGRLITPSVTDVEELHFGRAACEWPLEFLAGSLHMGSWCWFSEVNCTANLIPVIPVETAVSCCCRRGIETP
jgi:hypothetical protein